MTLLNRLRHWFAYVLMGTLIPCVIVVRFKHSVEQPSPGVLPRLAQRLGRSAVVDCVNHAGEQGLAAASGRSAGTGVGTVATLASGTSIESSRLKDNCTCSPGEGWMGHVRQGERKGAKWHKVSSEFRQAMPRLGNSRCRFTQAFQLEQAVRQEVLYMVGDSTFRNQFMALCLAIGGVIDWGDVELKSLPWAPSTCRGRLGTARVIAVFASSLGWSAEAVPTMRTVLKGMPPPTAIYVGAGLWLQWPAPFEDPPTKWMAKKSFAQYEIQLDNVLDAYGSISPVVLVSTVHAQCEERFRAEWAEVVKNRRASVESCAGWLLHNDQHDGQPLEALRELCRLGLRTRNGSHALNERLRAAISQRKRRVPAVHIVDTFALTDGRCDQNLPNDGVHFHFLLYEELSLVFATLGWKARDASLIQCPT